MFRLPLEECEKLEKLIEAYAFGEHNDDGHGDVPGSGHGHGQDDDDEGDGDFHNKNHGRDDHAHDELYGHGHGHGYGDWHDGDGQDHVQHQVHEDDGPLHGQEHDNEVEFVEVDPTNRYCRYPNLLGKGAIKKVYRGFDKENGIEVAWNQVNLNALDHVKNEVHFLESLNHTNIIKFYKFWVDEKKRKINFITELCTDNLSRFRQQHRHVCVKAVKDWSRQILRALAYLHSQNPPIMHRDIKCENILVNRSNGKIKVGDFGSATLVNEINHLHGLVGTPEFMAPEMYMENYNELVDIYAFGICMIELLTLETPYKECKNILQIYKAVTQGVTPKALDKVKDVDAIRFIQRCLAPVSHRPSAVELLADVFLRHTKEQSQPSMCDRHLLPKCASLPNLHPMSMLGCNAKAAREKKGRKKLSSHVSFVKSRNQKELEVTGEWENESKFSMRLRITHLNEPLLVRNVNFPFDSASDTPESVAEEMVQELNFPQSDSAVIADLIASVIKFLRQDKEDHALAEEASDVEFGHRIMPSYLKAIA